MAHNDRERKKKKRWGMLQNIAKKNKKDLQDFEKKLQEGKEVFALYNGFEILVFLL